MCRRRRRRHHHHGGVGAAVGAVVAVTKPPSFDPLVCLVGLPIPSRDNRDETKRHCIDLRAKNVGCAKRSKPTRHRGSQEKVSECRQVFLVSVIFLPR